MDLKIYVDGKGDSFTQEFNSDFDIECPFCTVVNRFIIEKAMDLYCSNCKKLMISIVNRKLVKKEVEKIIVKSIGELMEILLNGEYPYQRVDAAEALGQRGDMVCIPALIQASIQDVKKEVRDAASKALKEIKEKPKKDEFFQDISTVEEDAVDKETRENIKFLDMLTGASDMELIMLAREKKEKFTEGFFDFLATKVERALERKDQEMADKLNYILHTLDNLQIRRQECTDEVPETYEEEIPEVPEKFEISLAERKANLELLKILTNSSATEIIMIAKEEKEKFTKKFFTFLDRELEESTAEGNQERAGRIIYVNKILNNLKVREQIEEEIIEDLPVKTPEVIEDVVEEIVEFDEGISTTMKVEEEFEPVSCHLELLEQLIASSDMEIIVLAKKEKEKFNRRFFDFLDSQIQMCLDEDNQARGNSLNYVNQILENLKLREKARAEKTGEKPSEKVIEIEEIIADEEIIDFDGITEVEEEKIQEKPSEEIKSVEVVASDEAKYYGEFLERLITSSDMEIIMLAKKEKEKFTGDFFQFLDYEIQNAGYEKKESLSYLSQVLDNLKIRQKVEKAITPSVSSVKDKEPSLTGEETLKIIEEELALMLKNPPLEGKKLPEELSVKIISFPCTPVKEEVITVKGKIPVPSPEKVITPEEEDRGKSEEFETKEIPAAISPSREKRVTPEKPVVSSGEKITDTILPGEKDTVKLEEIELEEIKEIKETPSAPDLTLSGKKETGKIAEKQEKMKDKIGVSVNPVVKEQTENILPPVSEEIKTKQLKINMVDLGDEVDDYLKMLKNSPLPDDRKNAISSLIFMNDERIAPAIAETLLEDCDVEIRIMAAESLVALKDKSVVDIILRSIKEEKNPEVRKKSAWAYSKLKFAR